MKLWSAGSDVTLEKSWCFLVFDVLKFYIIWNIYHYNYKNNSYLSDETEASDILLSGAKFRPSSWMVKREAKLQYLFINVLWKTFSLWREWRDKWIDLENRYSKLIFINVNCVTCWYYKLMLLYALIPTFLCHKSPQLALWCVNLLSYFNLPRDL